jgi:hypothetical protein
MCGLALAACGQAVVAHVQASVSVRSALTSVFSNSTTRFVVTAQNLPGAASIADGSFSIVVTTSKAPATTSSAEDDSIELSIYHETTDLMDLAAIGGSEYVRVDLADVLAFAGPTEYTTVSGELNTLAAQPDLGFLHDLLTGNWIGVSASTLTALAQQLAPELPSAAASSITNLQKLSQNMQKVKQLSSTIRSSLSQAVRTWLSIHQKTSDEYSLNLPVRPFIADVVNELIKPVEALVNEPAISGAEITKAIDKVPADLSLNANLWTSDGSVSKIQAFIPRTDDAYLLIEITHPTTPLTAPAGATILTASNLSALVTYLLPTAMKALGNNAGGLLSL